MWFAWLALGCITDDQVDLRQAHWTDVAVGTQATCATRTDGTLRCWGAPAWLADTPIDADFVDVEVGERHACAIRNDGSATCWGEAEAVPVVNPEGPFDWLAMGVDLSCGGRNDGSWECWDTTDPYGGDEEWIPSGLPATVDAFALYTRGCIAEGTDVSCWSDADDMFSIGATNAPVVALAMSAINDSVAGDGVYAVDSSGTVYYTSTSFESPRVLNPVGDRFASVVGVGERFCGLDPQGLAQCSSAFEWLELYDETPASQVGEWATLSTGFDPGFDRVIVNCGISTAQHLGCWGTKSAAHYPR